MDIKEGVNKNNKICGCVPVFLGAGCISCLGNVRSFRAESVLVGHVGHGVLLTIGSGPGVAAPDLEGLALLSVLVLAGLQLRGLLARGSVAGLVAKGGDTEGWITRGSKCWNSF